MLSLDYIADYVEKNIKCTVYIGKLYSSKNNVDNTNVVAVYSTEAEHHTAVGGYKSYNRKGVKLLVHGNKNYVESEQLATKVYELFTDKKVEINGVNCIVQPKYSEPVCVGTDDYGIWEYVINAKVIYKEV